jgi:muconolactone delta-isomerase
MNDAVKSVERDEAREKAIAELIDAAAAWSPYWRKIISKHYRTYLRAGDRLATAIEKLQKIG